MKSKKTPKNTLQGYKYYIPQEHLAKLLSLDWAQLKTNLYYLFMQVQNKGKGSYSCSYMAKKSKYASRYARAKAQYIPKVPYIETKELSCIEGYVTIDSDILGLDEFALRIYLNFLRKPTKTWFRSKEGLGQKFSLDTLVQWGGLEAYLKKHKRIKTAERIKRSLKEIKKTNESQLSFKKLVMQGDKVVAFKIYKEPPPSPPLDEIYKIPNKAKKVLTTIKEMKRKGYTVLATFSEVTINKKQVTYKGEDIISLITSGQLSKHKAESLKCQPSQIIYRLIRDRLGHPPILASFIDDSFYSHWTGGEDHQPMLKLIKNA